MAKEKRGHLSGKVGDVIHSSWNGRAYIRKKPKSVANPRTEAQQSHRMAFAAIAALSNTMKEGHKIGLHTLAQKEKLDTSSMFKHINKNCYGPDGIDYAHVIISSGTVTSAFVTSAEVDTQGGIHVTFDGHVTPANKDDEFYLFVCCPDQRDGLCAAPVARTVGEVCATIEANWTGHPLHLYAFMKGKNGRTSNTEYVGQF